MESLDVSLWDEGFRSRLEKRMWTFAQELLRLGHSVVLEYGLWVRSERDEKVEGARAFGVEVELYFLDPPVEELRRRLERRGMEADAEVLPRLDEYSRTLQRPKQDELKQYDRYSLL
jgi:predicted kinase